MSYCIYVGRNLTRDGKGILAGYGDEPSSHWLEIVPRLRHEPGTELMVGVSPDADMPGHLTGIPQATTTSRYLCVRYSYYKGHPSPLINGGLNEYGVAVRDVWSPSRPELIAMTPKDQAGPNYSDLAKLVLERACTAREGVELIGRLIAEHGHCTYGGNSHTIADANEAWVVIEFAGGQGLWVAEKLDANAVRVSRPGYIGDIALTGEKSGDFLYSKNFVDFAASAGWYDPSGARPFNVNAIYGDGKGRWSGVQWMEEEIAKRAHRNGGVAFEDIVWALRTGKLTGDSAGYGQIVCLEDDTIPQLRQIWHAHIGAIAAPFIPVFLGVTFIPEEFRQHRYLSEAESRSHYGCQDETPDPGVPLAIEASRSATAVYKRLLYLMFQDGPQSIERIAAIWSGLEQRLHTEVERVRRTGKLLYDAREEELLASHLTYFSQTELLASLNQAEALASSLDVQVRALSGFHATKTRFPEQIW